MFQQLYSYGDTPELATDRNTSPTFEHDFEREFKLVDQKRLSSSSQSPCFSSTLYAVDGTSGSLSGTLPTFTFISHPQSSTQHMQIPAQIETNSQECGVQQQQQQHHQDHNQQQQQQQFEQKLEQSSSDTSALGHHFSTFHSMDSSHDLVANFPVHYPPQMYNPIDISSIVHSPILAELPTTLPPLHHTSLGVMLPHTRPAASAKEGENEDGSSRKKQKTAPKISRERAPWTPEEDNLLRLAVQLYGDKTEKWAKIAACVPGRTNKNCRKRWFHSLDPSLRKGAWTEEEDQLLREGVMKYPNQWSKIADMLDGRTDDQCAKRWRESLDPSIDRSEWTPEEDKKLMEKYEEYGSQWQKIAQFFEGRPGLHCRNRWRKLQRMNQIKKDKENAAALNRAAAAAPMAFVNGLEQDGRCKQRIREQQLASSSTGDALSSSSPSTIPNVISMLNERDSSSSSSPSSSSSATSILKIVDDDASKLQKRDDEPYSDLNPYGCDIPGCYASFPQSSGLFYHMKSAHPNLEGYPKPYRCAMPNCTKRYKNINGLQYHLREAKGSSGHGLIASKARVT